MEILSLWLPILLSAVIVFFASSILHMVLKHHKSDYKMMPGEDQVMTEMRKHSPGVGTYMFPFMKDMSECKSPEYLAKYKQGPVGILTILPGGDAPNMGRHLILWFIFCLIVSVFTAYICTPLGAGAHYGLVFRWAGTAAILGYAVSNIPDSIWKGQSWSVTLKFMFDGVVYALLTAGTFGWLWPESM
jgi:hypothetical protein